MGEISITKLLVVAALVVLLFGTKKLLDLPLYFQTPVIT